MRSDSVEAALEGVRRIVVRAKLDVGTTYAYVESVDTHHADPSVDTDELALVRRARVKGADGAAAYSELVRRHQAWLVRHLTFVLHSQSDAEDVAQDTFARAYLALDRAPPDRSFRAWLRVIGTRLAFNHRRANATRRRYEDRIELDLRDASALGDDAEQAAQLLARVSPANRHLLLLRYVDDLSVEEVAHTLGIEISATKMRLKRARQALLEAQRALEPTGSD